MLHINTGTFPPVFAAKGNQLDIAADICYAVGKFYSAMCKTDPKAGEIFREAVTAGIADPNSPTWKLRQAPGEIQIAMRVPEGGD